MNVDYDKLVQCTERLFDGFPELQPALEELLGDEEGPLVYTAMTLLVRTLIDDMQASRSERFAHLFEMLERMMRTEQFDVRNLLISGLLEDLSNLSEQAGIHLSNWEALLGESSLAGWRAVLDFWGGRITWQQFNWVLGANDIISP